MPILDKFSRQLPKSRKLFKKEILILLGLFLLMLLLRGGIEIRDTFVVDRAMQFDNWALTIARQPDNPEYLRGPHWVDEAVRDLTALGGAAVLTLTVIFVFGYLTLDSLLTRLETNSRIRIYTISIAILATIIVGVSRVLLGVHYPTDVLFGWTMGFFWASLCWFLMIVLQDQKLVEARLEVEPDVEDEYNHGDHDDGEDNQNSTV